MLEQQNRFNYLYALGTCSIRQQRNNIKLINNNLPQIAHIAQKHTHRSYLACIRGYPGVMYGSMDGCHVFIFRDKRNMSA